MCIFNSKLPNLIALIQHIRFQPVEYQVIFYFIPRLLPSLPLPPTNVPTYSDISGKARGSTGQGAALILRELADCQEDVTSRYITVKSWPLGVAGCSISHCQVSPAS